jgi:hypothetical protein
LLKFYCQGALHIIATLVDHSWIDKFSSSHCSALSSTRGSYLTQLSPIERLKQPAWAGAARNAGVVAAEGENV